MVLNLMSVSNTNEYRANFLKSWINMFVLKIIAATIYFMLLYGRISGMFYFISTFSNLIRYLEWNSIDLLFMQYLVFAWSWNVYIYELRRKEKYDSCKLNQCVMWLLSNNNIMISFQIHQYCCLFCRGWKIGLTPFPSLRLLDANFPTLIIC